MAHDSTAGQSTEGTNTPGENEPDDERLDNSGTSAEEAVAHAIEDGEGADKGH